MARDADPTPPPHVQAVLDQAEAQQADQDQLTEESGILLQVRIRRMPISDEGHAIVASFITSMDSHQDAAAAYCALERCTTEYGHELSTNLTKAMGSGDDHATFDAMEAIRIMLEHRADQVRRERKAGR